MSYVCWQKKHTRMTAGDGGGTDGRYHHHCEKDQGANRVRGDWRYDSGYDTGTGARLARGAKATVHAALMRRKLFRRRY